jgi:hypothetical protein
MKEGSIKRGRLSSSPEFTWLSSSRSRFCRRKSTIASWRSFRSPSPLPVRPLARSRNLPCNASPLNARKTSMGLSYLARASSALYIRLLRPSHSLGYHCSLSSSHAKSQRTESSPY